MLQIEPPGFLYSARVNSFPAEWKHSRSATLRNWRVSCRSEWLTDCTQLLHYVLILCPYAPVFAPADKQSRGTQYSPPLRLGLDPLLPHTSPQMSGYIAPPWSSQLPLSAPSASPHVTVSRPLAGHRRWDTKAINTSLGAPRPPAGQPCRVRPDQAWGWMEVDYVPGIKIDEGAEALPWLEHMVSPVILEPVGHLWMGPLLKAGFVTVCSIERLCLSFSLAEPGCSAGSGTPEWAENSWPIQSRLLPRRKPSPYPPSLAHQHPQTQRGHLAWCLPLPSPLFFLPLCPLAGFSVWI